MGAARESDVFLFDELFAEVAFLALAVAIVEGARNEDAALLEEWYELTDAVGLAHSPAKRDELEAVAP